MILIGYHDVYVYKDVNRLPCMDSDCLMMLVRLTIMLSLRIIAQRFGSGGLNVLVIHIRVHMNCLDYASLIDIRLTVCWILC